MNEWLKNLANVFLFGLYIYGVINYILHSHILLMAYFHTLLDYEPEKTI